MKRAVLISWFVVIGALSSSAAEAPSENGWISRAIPARLPWRLRFSGEERVRLESLGGIGFLTDDNSYLLQRLRLNIDLAPARWLRFSFQLQDSRVFFSDVQPAPASQKDRLDLRTAYLQIGDSETNRFSLRAGRQSLTFGEGRLLADPNWSNVGRSFDAVRLTIRYRNLKLDAFSGASDKVSTTGFDQRVPGEHVHGFYGSVENMVPGSVIEPYLVWRLEHNVRGEHGVTGSLDEKVVGLRWVGKVRKAADYGLELVGESGTAAGDRVIAWAGHAVAGYTLSQGVHRPRLFVELNRASGDQNPGDGVHGAFDPLFPSAHDKFGAADQFTWTNVLHARLGLQYRVVKNLLLTAAGNSFWLANRRDGIYSSGKVAIASTGRQGSHIGEEADLQMQWNPSRHMTVDAAYGRIFTGEFLRSAGRPVSYHCLLLGIAQRF